jgi:hypothetical protein
VLRGVIVVIETLLQKLLLRGEHIPGLRRTATEAVLIVALRDGIFTLEIVGEVYAILFLNPRIFGPQFYYSGKDFASSCEYSGALKTTMYELRLAPAF